MVCKGFLFLLFSHLLFNVYPYQNPQKKYKVSSIPLFVCVCVWVCESMCVRETERGRETDIEREPERERENALWVGLHLYYVICMLEFP